MDVKFLFTLVFLSIFAFTVLATILGAAKIWPFHRMPDKWIKILIGPLIIELAIAVIAVFTIFYSIKVQKYEFVVVYQDYLEDWMKTRSSEELNCINSYKNVDQMDDIPDNCKNAVIGYIRNQQSNLGHGNGQLYLETDDGTLSGVLIYKFPKDSEDIVFTVTGVEEEDGMKLTFSQQKGYAFTKEGNVIPWTAESFAGYFEKGDSARGVYSAPLTQGGVTYGTMSFY